MGGCLLVMALAAGIIGMVLVRGVPHIRWNFLTTTASVLKGTDGILPAILNTLYVILLTCSSCCRWVWVRRST